MPISIEEIALRSYTIWETEGRPAGREWEHWFQAEAELASEQEAVPAETQKPASSTRRKKASAASD